MTRTILISGMNYAPEMAGVGRYTGEIAEYLVGPETDVVVVTTPAHYPGWQVQGSFRKWGYSSERRRGVQVVRCPLVLKKKMSGVWRLIAPLTFATTSAPVVLWQMLRRRPKIAIMVMPTLLGAPAFLFGAMLAGAKSVLHVHDLEIDAAFAVGHLGDRAWLKSLAHAFERTMLRRFDQVVTISEKMADRLVEKGVKRENILVVRNWVDLDMIKPLATTSPYRKELGLGPRDFAVLYSGNIGRKQGLNVLAAAAERLAGYRHIRFVIAGEGPIKDDLVTRCAGLANITFLPFQPYERLSEFLGMANLHVLPQEASVADMVLPSKLGGMLASGAPIIVMSEPGTELTSFLDDSAGFVAPGDAEALAMAILAASREAEPDARRATKRINLAKRLSRRDGLEVFARAVVR